VRLPEPEAGLTLRPWAPGDEDALLAVAGDPELRRWTSIQVDDAAGARRWLRAQHDGWQQGVRYAFAVLDGDRLAGHVVLRDPGPHAEVGYWTAAHARGRGVAPRAVESLARWAFAVFPALAHLELLHQVGNTASCRVAVKSGFAYARTLPPSGPFPQEGHLHVRPRAAELRLPDAH
jgi:RimJ/RimL family protein N-acetyltransferase